jgi:hypothetical protein
MMEKIRDILKLFEENEARGIRTKGVVKRF